MKLEERQSVLENEMNTAKDTIWRLTNRVVHLEKELKILKTVFQSSSTAQNRVGIKKSILSISKTAKIAEIARRKQKLKDFNERIANASTSKRDDSMEIENIVVKEEADSECSDASLMPEHENCDPYFPNLSANSVASSSALNTSGENKLRRSSRVPQTKSMELDSSDSDSDSYDDGNDKDNLNTTGGRKSKIWRHFHTKMLKATATEKERILAICKHCKKQVSPKSDRLRNHIKKCLSSPKSAADSKMTSFNRTIDASVEDLEASYLMDMDSDSNHPLDNEVIAMALTQSSGVAENNIGRKKGPVWKHFATVTTVKSNGQLRIHAICKKCKKEVSPKSDRLRNHVIKCSIPQVDLPVRGNVIQKAQSAHKISAVETVPAAATSVIENVDSKISIVSKELEPDAGTGPSNTGQKSEAQKDTNLEPEDHVSNYSVEMLDPGSLSTSMSQKISGIKKGPVWQHFSTQTTQTVEGHTRITVTCNNCKKEVSPKSDRLKKHIEKCRGISIAAL